MRCIGLLLPLLSLKVSALLFGQDRVLASPPICALFRNRSRSGSNTTINKRRTSEAPKYKVSYCTWLGRKVMPCPTWLSRSRTTSPLLLSPNQARKSKHWSMRGRAWFPLLTKANSSSWQIACHWEP